MKSTSEICGVNELRQVIPRRINTSFGELYSITAGISGQPLILCVHGSGPTASSNGCEFLLTEYLARICFIEKFYLVAIDCPGYGQSKGSMLTIKTFPLQLFKEILCELGYRSYYAMYGRSQGGAAIFNAVYEDPSITQFLVMNSPVCGKIQRFHNLSLPTLLLYDVEDMGHPIVQGKQLYKQLINVQLYTHRSSTQPYWIPDNIWNKMLDFFRNQTKRGRKLLVGEEGRRTHRSYENSRQKSRKQKLKDVSADKIRDIRKNQIKAVRLAKIEEIEKSELMSVSHYQRSSDERQLQQQQKKSIGRQQQAAQLQNLLSSPPLLIHFNNQSPNLAPPPQLIDLIVQPQIEDQSKQLSPLDSQLKSLSIVSEINYVPSIHSSQYSEANRCSICFQTLFRPVVTNCGHTYCHACLLECLIANDTCPICRAKITKKTQNKELHHKIITELPKDVILKREEQLAKMEREMKNIVFVQIGNTSRVLETKQSAFSRTKQKYNWQLFVRQTKNYGIEEVAFNINRSDPNSKPVRIRNGPFTYESRGTFSFVCDVTIKLKNRDYPEQKFSYRIDIEPGYHSKSVPLRKKLQSK